MLVLLLRGFTRGFVKQIAVLLGLVIGTLVAIPFGVTDFGPVTDADVVGFPTPFHFGAPQFQLAAILSLCVVMVVSMTESTADMLALGEIVERPADERAIAAGLRADTLGLALSPLFNGFMCSAFAQNIGLVAMTRIRSRYVVATGGGFLVLMGLCPMAASLIAVVPRPVLGGAGVVLFGSVAASGIQTLVRAGLEKDNNVLIVAVSLAVGIIPITAPHFYHAFPRPRGSSWTRGSPRGAWRPSCSTSSSTTWADTGTTTRSRPRWSRARRSWTGAPVPAPRWWARSGPG